MSDLSILIEELESRGDRLSLRAVDALNNSKKLELRALKAEKIISEIEEIMSGHPTCDKYSEDDPITCGWKNAYASVQLVLDNNK